LIVEAVRRGACEFLERPPATTALLEALSRLGSVRRRGGDEGRGKVITVLNAKELVDTRFVKELEDSGFVKELYSH